MMTTTALNQEFLVTPEYLNPVLNEFAKSWTDSHLPNFRRMRNRGGWQRFGTRPIDAARTEIAGLKLSSDGSEIQQLTICVVWMRATDNLPRYHIRVECDDPDLLEKSKTEFS